MKILQKLGDESKKNSVSETFPSLHELFMGHNICTNCKAITLRVYKHRAYDLVEQTQGALIFQHVTTKLDTQSYHYLGKK